MLEAEERPVADRMDDVPLPEESTRLFGHEEAIARFTQAYASSRMHHGWLINGPRGIGKATLAFHLARHIIAHPDPKMAPSTVDPETWPHQLVRQVGQGAHPGLLHITRSWDQKAKRFMTQISVDEIRRTQSFYGLTAASDSWRVTIVDAADEMNSNAANALLKMLEEPPKRSVLFLIAHSAGSLLPTIRSRCQSVTLQPLSNEELSKTLDHLGQESASGPTVELAEGSVRRAIKLGQGNVLAAWSSFDALMKGRAGGSAADWAAVHRLADGLLKKDAADDYSLFIDLVLSWIGQQARNRAGAESLSSLAGWSRVWDNANRAMVQSNAYNLDRKQLVLTVMQLIFDRNKQQM